MNQDDTALQGAALRFAGAGFDVGTDQAAGRAIPLAAGDELDAYTRRDLIRLERDIADKYHTIGQKQMVPYVVGAVLCFALWVSFFPLTILGIVPLPVAFVLSTLFMSGCWIVGHEAMHSGIGAKGSKLRRWNEIVGVITMIPLMFPFSIAKITHLQHHRFVNDPLKDPDYPDAAPTMFKAILKIWLNRQPGKDNQVHHIRRIIVEDIATPGAKTALKHLLLAQLAGHLFLIGMALSGYAVEVALVWWLPRWIGLIHIHLLFGWEPHSPHIGNDRYKQARVYRSVLGSWGSMGVEHHLVHHLHPHIPIHLTAKAYREMKPILQARGVDCSAQ